MLISRSKRLCVGRSKRSNSVYVFNDSWKSFYTSEGDPVGRGGAGKVFCVKPNEEALKISERKKSAQENSDNNTFGQNCELINVVPNGKHLAVKLIRRFRGGRDSIEKIRNEINLMKSLQIGSYSSKDVPSSASPFLVSIHEDPTEVAIVMEYALGGSLFDLCHLRCGPSTMLPSQDEIGLPNKSDNHSIQSKIPESYISQVLQRITDALVYMHEKANIVHLDIKAENILLRRPYPSPDVFITDFGLASVLNESKPHRELAGTPDYTAPEVISYDPVTFATDMWSLGILTYFMLTRVSPFLADTKALTMSNITQMKIEYPESLFVNVSATAQDFVKSLIKREPRQRLTASKCLKHDWLQQQRIVNPASVDSTLGNDGNIVVVDKITKPSPKRFALIDDPNPPEAISISSPQLPHEIHTLPPIPLDTSSKRKLVKQHQSEPELPMSPRRGCSETRGGNSPRPNIFYLLLPPCILPPSIAQTDDDKQLLVAKVPVNVNSPVD